jgi:hypothetical protein
MSQLLIDRIIPEFEFVERHAATVAAPPAIVYRTLKQVDFARSPTIRLLFGVRGLAPRFRQGRRRMRARLDDFLAAGFLLLGEQPDREVVVGVLWGRSAPAVDAPRFASFAEPGHVKAVLNFTVRPHGAGSLVATETRVHATDQGARRRFARYWLVVGPFSALIRRRMLALLRAEVRRALASDRSARRPS